MTGNVPNIEQIVAEVVRRLKLLADAPEPSLSRPVAAAAPVASPQSTITQSAATQSAATQSKHQELTLDARVVTTATLHGRLNGVRRVLVNQRAVVTPSVKDELRKRGIRLEVCSEANCATTAADLTVVRCLCLPEAVRAAASLPLPNGAAEQLCGELGSAVRCAAESVREAGSVAVVLTDQSLAAVCLLNRHTHVRAARARSVDEVKQAILAIGANALVIDPGAVTTNQWHVMIQTCRKDLPRGCPPALQTRSV